MFARQSTARTFTVGPVLDADGVAVTGGVVADFEVSKNGADPAALNGSATLTHRGVGFYSLAATASDFDTVGTAQFSINDTVNGCARVDFDVLEEAVYDALFASSALGYVANAPVSVAQWAGSAVATPTVAGVPEVDITHIDGLSTSGNNATLNLKQLNVVNNAGSAVIASSTGSNGHGIAASGNGSGEGLSATGGNNGSGIEAVGGSSAGYGLSVRPVATNHPAAYFEGNGSGAGLMAAGGATGPGLYLYGGATSGDGMKVEAAGSGLDINAANSDIGAATAAELAKVPKSDGTSSWNATALAAIQTEANDALVANHLDHLLATAYDPASKPGAADALLNELVEDDGGVARYTTNALEQGPTGSGASAASIADAVWDEATSGHTTSGTFGEQAKTDIDAILADTTTLLSRITSSLFAGITSLAQWLGLIAGKQTGNSTARTEVRATGAGSGTFDETTDSQEALRDRGDAAWTTATGFSTHAAADVWAVGTRTLTAIDEDSTTLDLDATIRAAVGLSSANLDTQIGDLPTNEEMTALISAADDAVLAAIAALENLSAAEVTAAVPTAVQNADALLKRDFSSVTGEATRSALNSLRFLRNKWSIAGGTLTVTKEDDSTDAWTAAVTQTAGDPVSAVDPT